MRPRRISVKSGHSLLDGVSRRCGQVRHHCCGNIEPMPRILRRFKQRSLCRRLGPIDDPFRGAVSIRMSIGVSIAAVYTPVRERNVLESAQRLFRRSSCRFPWQAKNLAAEDIGVGGTIFPAFPSLVAGSPSPAPTHLTWRLHSLPFEEVDCEIARSVRNAAETLTALSFQSRRR
jgi:hypothetical protein